MHFCVDIAYRNCLIGPKYLEYHFRSRNSTVMPPGVRVEHLARSLDFVFLKPKHLVLSPLLSSEFDLTEISFSAIYVK